MNHSVKKETLKKTSFHLMTIDETYKKLGTKENGLSNEDPRRRLEDFVKNKLPSKKEDSTLKRFFD